MAVGFRGDIGTPDGDDIVDLIAHTALTTGSIVEGRNLPFTLV
jgi:hypothetical protein